MMNMIYIYIYIYIYMYILWMEEILHQLVGGLSHYRVQPSKVVQEFIHPHCIFLYMYNGYCI